MGTTIEERGHKIYCECTSCRPENKLYADCTNCMCYSRKKAYIKGATEQDAIARAEERERCIKAAQYLYCKRNCPSFGFCINTVGRRRFLLAECEGREDIRKAIEGGEQ